MSKPRLPRFSPGEYVYVLYSGNRYHSALVRDVRKTWTGKYKYLISYQEHNWDYDYSYDCIGWAPEKLLFQQL